MHSMWALSIITRAYPTTTDARRIDGPTTGMIIGARLWVNAPISLRSCCRCASSDVGATIIEDRRHFGDGVNLVHGSRVLPSREARVSLLGYHALKLGLAFHMRRPPEVRARPTDLPQRFEGAYLRHQGAHE